MIYNILPVSYGVGDELRKDCGPPRMSTEALA
jgi:hypothetical protein